MDESMKLVNAGCKGIISIPYMYFTDYSHRLTYVGETVKRAE